ncbi:hypothetical protein MYAER_0660 [Microcystis aeruginosa NIES-2549]|uniref:Uncharacterized protein n=1 Tax=Microcystis aeruginosa NIES-2549 TaxID=1641812 RepID=A0A0F6RJK4_MICAE|nr:hypothetical protein MYAER_0660 [Microcystis aeruginosa NIES-2549]AOC51414.1 hypothetical protein amyaer_0665 [Microcystis aeruginosa NIES-2481]
MGTAATCSKSLILALKVGKSKIVLGFTQAQSYYLDTFF